MQKYWLDISIVFMLSHFLLLAWFIDFESFSVTVVLSNINFSRKQRQNEIKVDKFSREMQNFFYS